MTNTTPPSAEGEDLTLHQMPNSGNSYKIRLVASFLSIPLKLTNYNVLANETRTPHFLANINANGRVPVLQIGSDTFLPESSAACYYLASSPSAQGRAKLVPEDRLQHAQMLQWMFFEQYSHEPALAVLKYWRHQLGISNLSELQKAQIPGKERQAREVLGVMERHLSEGEGSGGREWFVGGNVTLADVVLFAYTHTAHWSGFDLGEWPAVEAWVERFRGVEGFVGLGHV